MLTLATFSSAPSEPSLNIVLQDQPHHPYLLFLPVPVHPIHGLILHCRIPPPVHKEHPRRHHQIYPSSYCFQTSKQYLWCSSPHFSELVHQFTSFLQRHRSIHLNTLNPAASSGSSSKINISLNREKPMDFV